jgi:hypothetical protein
MTNTAQETENLLSGGLLGSEPQMSAPRHNGNDAPLSDQIAKIFIYAIASP